MRQGVQGHDALRKWQWPAAGGEKREARTEKRTEAKDDKKNGKKETTEDVARKWLFRRRTD
jgi:hypothetical protein